MPKYEADTKAVLENSTLMGCETWLEDIGITKEGVQSAAGQFITTRHWISKENLEKQIARLEKGKKTGVAFNTLLKIQQDIEDIKKVLIERG